MSSGTTLRKAAAAAAHSIQRAFPYCTVTPVEPLAKLLLVLKMSAVQIAAATKRHPLAANASKEASKKANR